MINSSFNSEPPNKETTMLNRIKELNNEIHKTSGAYLRDYPDLMAEVKQLNKTAKMKAAEVDEIVEICRSN